jgi:hypothetical protein
MEPRSGIVERRREGEQAARDDPAGRNHRVSCGEYEVILRKHTIHRTTFSFRLCASRGAISTVAARHRC